MMCLARSPDAFGKAVFGRECTVALRSAARADTGNIVDTSIAERPL
jgi:hypothetical protein